jgi:DME family drug/metabolite transporter
LSLRSPKPISTRLSGILIALIATVCWSTSGIFIKLIIKETGLSAVGLAFWRDLTTSIMLLLGILLIKPKLLIVKKSDLPWLIGMGAISIGVFHTFWNKAVIMLGASLATVFQSNAPIFVTLMAWFLFGEKITIRKIIAVILAVMGTILVSGIKVVGEWKIVPIGLLIAMGSAFTYGSLSLFGKKLSAEYSAWTIMFYIFSFGSLTLFAMQLGQPDRWPSSSNFLPLFFSLVLVSTIVGFTLYTISLKFLPASVASITAASEILFASILAFIFLQERLDFWQILGSALIISGVVLVSLTNDNGFSNE